jgi:hypothetical protein
MSLRAESGSFAVKGGDAAMVVRDRNGKILGQSG